MMRTSRALRTGLTALVAVAMAACAMPSQKLTASPDSATPLDVVIYPPYYGQLSIGLNKPAYLALFEILPGRGVSLLYPRSGSGYSAVKETWVPLAYSAQRWLYSSYDWSDPGAGQWSGFDARYSMVPAAYGYGGRGYNARALNQSPRYFFVVASDEPIAIDQFQNDLASLRDYLGTAQYASLRPYDVMEKLAYALVPYTSDDRWVTDVFVDWGYDWGYGYSPATSAALSAYQPVLCSDGSVAFALYYAGYGLVNGLPCTPWQQGQTQPTAPWLPGQPGQPGTPGDTTGGRDRTGKPGADSRHRAGAAATAELQSSAEIRNRIAQLRGEALDQSYRTRIQSGLRQTVALRNRAERRAAMAPNFYGHDAISPRARSGSGGSGSATRADADHTPRARGTSSAPAPQTRTEPSTAPSSSPRSREGSSSSPPPASSAPRTRPPAR